MPSWEQEYDKVSKKEFVDALTVDILCPFRRYSAQISKPIQRVIKHSEWCKWAK